VLSPGDRLAFGERLDVGAQLGGGVSETRDRRDDRSALYAGVELGEVAAKHVGGFFDEDEFSGTSGDFAPALNRAAASVERRPWLKPPSSTASPQPKVTQTTSTIISATAPTAPCRRRGWTQRRPGRAERVHPRPRNLQRAEPAELASGGRRLRCRSDDADRRESPSLLGTSLRHSRAGDLRQ